MNKSLSADVAGRRMLQWYLLPVVIITIGLGWKYPLLGFTVPAVMLMGMVGGIFRGRYVCGHLCPRGSFFDRMVRPVSRNSAIPAWLRNMYFRWVVFAAMMGFMIFQITRNPSSINHWGRVFWIMCVVTTSIGVVLGLFIHPRAWCAFCPMGTLQRVLGGRKQHLRIDSAVCQECRACEKACPFSLLIVRHKAEGRMENPDCLKCPECAAACPKNALTWSDGKKTSPKV